MIAKSLPSRHWFLQSLVQHFCFEAKCRWESIKKNLRTRTEETDKRNGCTWVVLFEVIEDLQRRFRFNRTSVSKWKVWITCYKKGENNFSFSDLLIIQHKYFLWSPGIIDLNSDYLFVILFLFPQTLNSHLFLLSARSVFFSERTEFSFRKLSVTSTSRNGAVFDKEPSSQLTAAEWQIFGQCLRAAERPEKQRFRLNCSLLEILHTAHLPLVAPRGQPHAIAVSRCPRLAGRVMENRKWRGSDNDAPVCWEADCVQDFIWWGQWRSRIGTIKEKSSDSCPLSSI